MKLNASTSRAILASKTVVALGGSQNTIKV